MCLFTCISKESINACTSDCRDHVIYDSTREGDPIIKSKRKTCRLCLQSGDWGHRG